MGKHERKDPQTGEGSEQKQPEPKGSGRPGKHRKVTIDSNSVTNSNSVTDWKPVIG